MSPNVRRLLVVLLLGIAVGLERGAYYGLRSAIWGWLEAGGPDTVRTLPAWTAMNAFAPILGGVAVIAIRPAWVAAAGLALCALGYACLVAVSPAAAIVPLAIASLGTGLAKIGILIALANTLTEENLRNAGFASYYLVTNGAAFVATLAAGPFVARFGFRPFAPLMALLPVGAVVAVLIGGLLQRGGPDPAPAPGSGRGLLGLALVGLPVLAFFAAESATGSLEAPAIGIGQGLQAFFYQLNPLSIAVLAPFVIVLLLVFQSLKVRVSTTLVMGVGLLFAPLAVGVEIAGQTSPAAAAAAELAFGFGELLVGTFILSRAASSAGWRWDGLALGAWLALSYATAWGGDAAGTGSLRAIAIAAGLMSFVGGLALAIGHRAFDQAFFPEPA